MKKAILSLGGIATAAQLHAEIARQLNLPEYYGANLDALHDCLTEISEPTCIGVFGLSEQEHPGFVQVMKDSEQENPNLGIIFSDPELNSSDESDPE